MRTNRRAFLSTVVVGVGVSGAGSANRLAAVAKGASAGGRTLRAVAAPRLPVASALTLPLEGVKVVAVHPIHFGALPVILEHEGHRFQVDVFRRAAFGTDGVVNTQHFSFFVRNGGDGSSSTGKTSELGVRALAIALEADGGSADLAPALLTFEERATRFPGGAYAAYPTTVVSTGAA